MNTLYFWRKDLNQTHTGKCFTSRPVSTIDSMMLLISLLSYFVVPFHYTFMFLRFFRFHSSPFISSFCPLLPYFFSPFLYTLHPPPPISFLPPLNNVVPFFFNRKKIWIKQREISGWNQANEKGFQQKN